LTSAVFALIFFTVFDGAELTGRLGAALALVPAGLVEVGLALTGADFTGAFTKGAAFN
jgi:hypothetical protein